MTIALVPQEQETVQRVTAQVSQVVTAAHAIEVGSPEQAQHAAEFLKQIAAAKSHVETSRKELADPLHTAFKRINALFKPKTEELEEADKLVRGKLIAFQQEQERQRAAEQARLDAIRREEEEKAEAERRRLAQEAAEAERQAVEAEAQRQAEIAASASARRQEIGALTDGELLEMSVDKAGHPDAEMADQEIAQRLEAHRAQERADKARQSAEEAQQREIAAKSAPALAVAIPTALAGVSERKEWKGTVIDPSLVPEEYKIIDQKKINAVVKAGVRSIPGVKIEQVPGLAVRAK